MVLMDINPSVADAGFYRYLTKPVQVDERLSTLQERLPPLASSTAPRRWPRKVCGRGLENAKRAPGRAVIIAIRPSQPLKSARRGGCRAGRQGVNVAPRGQTVHC